MDRRSFLRAGMAGGAALTLGPAFWRGVYAAPAQPGPGPYGALQAADANGIMLPSGFTSKVLARGGELVPGTTYPWHVFPDGGATFPQPGGGWIYTSNSEVPSVPATGGAGALVFGPNGQVTGAHRICSGTSQNCGGGATPWGTWLSGEEHDKGKIWECDPTGVRPAVALPALGTFAHEAVAVDPVQRRLYLTEDKFDGRFYRFTPTAYPDLTAGLLEVAVVAADGSVTWATVPDPSAASQTTRSQVAGSTAFNGGEGVWFDSGIVYFTTKGDNKVWAYDTVASRIDVLYDPSVPGAPLTGVDNIVVTTPVGDIYVAEDGGNMEMVLITYDRVVTPFLRIVGQSASEVAGPAFDPSGTRLYFSSQRGGIIPSTIAGSGFGITYEVTGPFRLERPAVVPTVAETLGSLSP